MTVRAVSRADRARDAIAGAILAVGATVWLYGYLGLRDIEQRGFTVLPGGPSAVEQAVRFWNFTRVGAVVLILGTAALVWSFWQHFRQRRST